MNLRHFVGRPIVAAVLGAALVGVPVGTFYGVSFTHGSVAHAHTPDIRAASATATVTPASAPDNRAAVLPDFSTMVETEGPAVVNISVVTKGPGADDEHPEEPDPFNPFNPFAPFFRGSPFPSPVPPLPIRGEGSGFIVRSDGLILTNAHVVKGSSEVTVRLTDRREYTAKVIGVDSKSDVAVIKIAAKDLPTVEIGDSHSLKVGEWVLAIGAPFGFENSATAGIVSAKGRTLPESGYVPFIQTDVPINPGNSGGPLFNMRGEVVGINSQIYSRTGGYMGLAFAIPIDVAMQVAQQLETTGHVSRGQLGVVIQAVTQGLADSFGLQEPEGALVASVQKGGPAERAGIEPGDVILKLNGQPVHDSTELPVQIASLTPGTTVKLEVLRKHAKLDVNVALDAMDNERTAFRGGGNERPGGKLGLATRPLTPEERRQAHAQGGLLVERVARAAAEAGLQPGDVVLSANGAPVSTVEDLRRAIESSKGHVALLVQRGDTRLFLPVRVR
jgi:serine protease Do